MTNTDEIKDPEVRAIGALMDALEPLDDDARRRVLSHLAAKYGISR